MQFLKSFIAHISPITKVKGRLTINPSSHLYLILIIFYIGYIYNNSVNWWAYNLVILFIWLAVAIIFSKNFRNLGIIILAITLFFNFNELTKSNNLAPNTSLDQISGTVAKIESNNLDLINSNGFIKNNKFYLGEIRIYIGDFLPLKTRFIRQADSYIFFDIEYENDKFTYNEKSHYQDLDLEKSEFDHGKLYYSIEQKLNMNLQQPELGMVKSLLIGDRTELNYDLRQAMIRLGIYHLISISGLHLMQVYILSLFFVVLLAIFIPNIYSFRLASFLIEAVAIALAFLYIYFLDFPVPALRSWIFILSFSLSKYILPHVKSSFRIGLIALVMIIIEPELIGNVSFNLSFFAVLALAIAYSLNSMIRVSYNSYFKLINYILMIFLSSIVIGIFSLPLILNTFGFINIFQSINNIVHVPYTTFILIPLIFIGLPLFAIENLGLHIGFLGDFYFYLLNLTSKLWVFLIDYNDMITKDFIVYYKSSNDALWWVVIILIFLTGCLVDFWQKRIKQNGRI